jgi:hypothetical protein
MTGRERHAVETTSRSRSENGGSTPIVSGCTSNGTQTNGSASVLRGVVRTAVCIALVLACMMCGWTTAEEWRRTRPSDCKAPTQNWFECAKVWWVGVPMHGKVLERVPSRSRMLYQ